MPDGPPALFLLKLPLERERSGARRSDVVTRTLDSPEPPQGGQRPVQVSGAAGRTQRAQAEVRQAEARARPAEVRARQAKARPPQAQAEVRQARARRAKVSPRRAAPGLPVALRLSGRMG